MWENEYRFFNGDYSWEEAQTICEQNDGNLVTISDEAMNEDMKSLCTSGLCWIGLHSIDSGENWNWIDGSDSTYRDPLFESQSAGTTEFCATLATSVSGYTTGWHLNLCSGSQHVHSVLCEIQISSLGTIIFFMCF